MSEKKAKAKPPPIRIGGSTQAVDSPDGGFISGVGSVIE